MRGVRSIRYYPRFPEAVPVRGAGCPRVTQPFATLCTPGGALTVRLACVRRAASVHPEPGSNSPFKVPGGSCRRASRLVRPSRPKIPLISDSLKLTSLCVRDSNFAGLSSSISRSQYPVFKVRRAGRGRLPRRCAGINYTHPAAPRGRESRGSRFLHNSRMDPSYMPRLTTLHAAVSSSSLSCFVGASAYTRTTELVLEGRTSTQESSSNCSLRPSA